MKANPFKKFILTLNSENFTLSTENFIKPNLPAILSTSTSNGIPSARTLYIKKVQNNELLFFTNENSRKGKEISQNPNVSLCFFFQNSFNQIIIEGKAFKADSSIAKQYFSTRSKLSQAGAILSKQSSVLNNYKEFTKKAQALSLQDKLECPDFWCCYRVIPSRFEFWRGDKSRLHIREVFVLEQQNWKQINLYP